jgi:pimeloyl-ACP methyl ester carboxylesterase
MKNNFFQTQTGQIAYSEMGEGPLIVCAPSIGDVRAQYRILAPRLAQAGYRVVSIDLRGLGESSTRWDDYSVVGVGQDLLALVRALGGGPAALIGNSMSAGAAIWAAVEANRAEEIAGLVLIGPAVHGEVSGFNQLLYRTLFARPWGPAAWAAYYRTLYPTQKPADFDRYLAALRANLQEAGRMEALTEMMLASKAASEARLSQVTTPTLVVMGSKDPDFKDPAAEAGWVAAQVHGLCEVIPGAGHYPHVEMPDVTLPLILQFLQGIPALHPVIQGAVHDA